MMGRTTDLTASFFAPLRGKIVDVKTATVPTYTSQYRAIPCPNYFIEFDNSVLLGEGNFSTEVYPRYRKLRNDWRRFLQSMHIPIFEEIAPGFVPLLSSRHSRKETYESSPAPLGTRIVTIDETSSQYYQDLKKRYGVAYALREEGGMLIGPEGGMLQALEMKIEQMRPSSFMDVGAGTGELSSYALKNGVRTVITNELSPSLHEHLKSYLGAVAATTNGKAIFALEDCLTMRLPEKIDLMSVGVFYGSQPEFFLKQGKTIANAMGDEGVLIVQSSMPETLFNHLLLDEAPAGMSRWPWYAKEFSLRRYFSNCQTTYLDNEFITFASNNRSINMKNTINELYT